MLLLPENFLHFFSGLKDKDLQIQSAGIDLTVDKVYEFLSRGEIGFHNNERKLSECKELPFENGKLFLKPGCYKIKLSEHVAIPEDCVGVCLPRSSLLRCGVAVFSAVWDPGYRGRGEMLLVVFNPHGFILREKARVAQMIFFRLKGKAKPYSGIYKEK